MSDAIKRPLIWSQTIREINLIVNVFNPNTIIIEVKGNVIRILGVNSFEKMSKTDLTLYGFVDERRSKYRKNVEENTIEFCLWKKSLGLWKGLLFDPERDQQMDMNSRQF